MLTTTTSTTTSALEQRLTGFLDSTHVRCLRAHRERYAAAVASGGGGDGGDGSFYPLTAEEVDALKRQGNTAEDWGRVFKLHGERHVQTTRIRDCDLQGTVVLGDFAHELEVDGVRLPAGCYRATLRDTLVLDGALVRDTTALCRVIVDERAAVIACGSVRGTTTSSHGNGQSLRVGVELGGRDLRVFAELPFDVAASIAGDRRDPGRLEAYEAFVDQYAAAVAVPFTLVGHDARVRGCCRIEDACIGAFATIEDAEVRRVTVLSTQDEPSSIRGKSIVRDALVQWNASIEDQGFVERGFLCDASHVGRQGLVLNSLIGPNTSIAEGEVTSCFVGPFVGFHHQALLIASFWPEGRGNVGYGANVGSNHTLKAPDQELFPGEGVFFGLGCCVKFPSNFTRAPYSVLATGVATLPQCVEMPFALINTPGHNIKALSPAINEISPAWVLAHSVFTVLRNEAKFATRNRSKRTHVEGPIFRPEIIGMMKTARKRLTDCAGTAKIKLPRGELIYTDREVPGLGKNYMRETARTEAIAAYGFFIELYALEGLLKWLEEGRIGAQINSLTVSDVPSSTCALQTLHGEFPANLSLAKALEDLVARRHKIVEDAIRGKSRDDARGQRIIPDYVHVHARVEDEGPVRYARRIANDVKQRVSRFVSKL